MPIIRAPLVAKVQGRFVRRVAGVAFLAAFAVIGGAIPDMRFDRQLIVLSPPDPCDVKSRYGNDETTCKFVGGAGALEPVTAKT